jgi:hypothetical protein
MVKHDRPTTSPRNEAVLWTNVFHLGGGAHPLTVWPCGGHDGGCG